MRQLVSSLLLALTLACFAEAGIQRMLAVEAQQQGAKRASEVAAAPRVILPVPVASTLPPRAAIPSRCNSTEPLSDHFLVAARHDEDVSWMATHLQNTPFIVYQAGDEGVPHHYPNIGREAMAYLTFLAEYYDCMPEVTAFTHAHRSSWHSPDMVLDMERLRWDHVPGYATLSRRGSFHWLHFSTLRDFRPPRLYPADPERHLETQLAAGPEAHNGSFSAEQIIGGVAYPDSEVLQYSFARKFAIAWRQAFEPLGMGPLSPEIRYPCCAQFAVTRERVHAWPRDFYLQVAYWLQWGSGDLGSYHAGLMLEIVWAIMFGEPSIMPGLTKVECELYRCDPGWWALSWHTVPGVNYR